MRAAVITRPGGPEVLEIREVPRPEARAGEILVRVRASALNRADLLQRAGRYPVPPGAPADIPGLEFAGEVAALGEGATRWNPGDRVFGLAAGGAHAEYLTAHERAVARVPDAMSWRDAGASPEAFITAHDAMVTQGGMRMGERVLIHAVGSGVGLAAVQLARAASAVPYGTSRTEDKIERARPIGLEDGVVPGPGFAAMRERVAAWTGDGMDLVLDLVGGTYLAAGVQAFAPRGRLILVGTVAGAEAQLDLRRVLGRRLTIRGTVLRARPLEEKIQVTRAWEREVVPLLGRGTLRPIVELSFPLERIAEAHARLQSDETFGKVAIEIA